jgi:hypothetical protein
MSDREILFTALDGVERRLRLNRNLKHLTVAASSLLAAGIVAVVLGIFTVPRGGLFGLSVVGTFFVAVAVMIVTYSIVRVVQRGTRAEAAAQADLRGGLHDTLASALWFSTSHDASPWIPLVMARAARMSARLDPVRLVPIVAPRGARTVVALALALGVLSWIAPKFAPTADAVADDATAGRRADAARVAELRKLADEAGQRGDAVAKAKLEQVLAALERPGASAEDKRHALEEAAQLAEQRNLEAATARERLRQVADQLGGRAEFGAVAEALRAGDAKGAAEALRQVAAARGEPTAPREPAATDGAKPPDDGSLTDALQESLQSAAQNPDRDVNGETQGKIAKAVQNLEEIAKRLDSATALNQARRKLNAASMSMARESRLRAARFGQQEGKPNGQSPETGAASIQGGTMYRQAAVGKEKAGEREGGRTGDASGNAQGDPVLGDEVKRPDAKYRLETVKSEDRGGEDTGEDLFYAASRQGESKMQVRAGPQPQYRHAAEEAMSPERIALRHRPIVKRYFTQLRERDAK